MLSERPAEIEHIEADVKSHMVCSNLNRVCMLYLLRKSPKQEMQAEEMAFRLGLSHRTILYHLDVLHDYNLVEVRKYRRRGNRMMRSVWGLRQRNGQLDNVFFKIESDFDCKQLENRICQNAAHQ